jgi:integrase
MSTPKRKTNRASFGSTRKLPSGRWQARYPDIAAGRVMTGPSTFATKRDALAYLASVQSDRLRGSWIDHRAGLAPFGPYAEEWIANGGSRGRLAPRTRETYEDLLRGPLAHFHDLALSAVTTAEVRSWYSRTGKVLAKAAKARGGSGAERLRLSYVLLRAIMATAVSDGLVASNPCQIKGAGSAKTAERPHLAPEALGVIVEGMPEWSHLPIRVMFGGHLRLGELVALQRRDFDGGVLTVERQVVTVGRETMTTATKTGDARTVRLPGGIAAEVESHLSSSPGAPKGPMFTRADGKPVTAGMLQRAFRASARAAGLGEFHLHDVRHSGLTLAAQMGGTTRELMARAGHRTSRAALIYQHAAEERSQVLADLMDAASGGALRGANGTGMARQALEAPVDEAVESTGNTV